MWWDWGSEPFGSGAARKPDLDPGGAWLETLNHHTNTQSRAYSVCDYPVLRGFGITKQYSSIGISMKTILSAMQVALIAGSSFLFSPSAHSKSDVIYDCASRNQLRKLAERESSKGIVFMEGDSFGAVANLAIRLPRTLNVHGRKFSGNVNGRIFYFRPADSESIVPILDIDIYSPRIKYLRSYTRSDAPVRRDIYVYAQRINPPISISTYIEKRRVEEKIEFVTFGCDVGSAKD